MFCFNVLMSLYVHIYNVYITNLYNDIIFKITNLVLGFFFWDVWCHSKVIFCVLKLNSFILYIQRWKFVDSGPMGRKMGYSFSFVKYPPSGPLVVQNKSNQSAPVYGVCQTHQSAPYMEYATLIKVPRIWSMPHS